MKLNKKKHSPNKKPGPTISVLIPCHNEELGISACLQSCLNQEYPFHQIIVIDDASTDNTVKVIEKKFAKYLKKHFITLIKLTQNKGNKSFVQEHGLQYITSDYFVSTDGDTILDSKFVKTVLPHFQKPKVESVAGHVQSLSDNWLTACREIEYTIAQILHKQAQSFNNTITVIPGCCAVFRTNTFKKIITFDHDTLTEDLDFTYKLHSNNHQIIYEPKAIVYTQDPADIRSYYRQMRRWYAGNWQNFRKHSKTLLQKKSLGLEIVFAYSESLFLSAVLLAIPIFSLKLALKVYVGLLVFSFIASIVCSYRTKRLDVIIYSPALLITLHLNSYLFLSEAIRYFVLNRKDMVWHSALRKEIS